MKERIKKPRDWTVKDFIDYVHHRICDGNWSMTTAMYMCECYSAMPKLFKRKWWSKNASTILNYDSEAYINIETGQIIPECPYEVEIEEK